MLEEASAPLERFFAPYNQLLREIIGPTFGWEAKDHRKRVLSPEQKAAALAAITRVLKKQRNGQVSRRVAEKMKVDEIRERTSRGVVMGVVTPLKKLPLGSSLSERGRGRGRGQEGGGGDDKEGLRALRKKKKLAHKAELERAWGGHASAHHGAILSPQVGLAHKAELERAWGGHARAHHGAVLSPQVGLAHKAELERGGDGKAKALRRQKKLKLGARATDSAESVAAVPVAAITRRRRGEDSSA